MTKPFSRLQYFSCVRVRVCMYVCSCLCACVCVYIYLYIYIVLALSQDFSTSSLQGEVAIENFENVVDDDGDSLSIYQISERKRWEQK